MRKLALKLSDKRLVECHIYVLLLMTGSACFNGNKEQTFHNIAASIYDDVYKRQQEALGLNIDNVVTLIENIQEYEKVRYHEGEWPIDIFQSDIFQQEHTVDSTKDDEFRDLRDAILLQEANSLIIETLIVAD